MSLQTGTGWTRFALTKSTDPHWIFRMGGQSILYIDKTTGGYEYGTCTTKSAERLDKQRRLGITDTLERAHIELASCVSRMLAGEEDAWGAA